MKDKFRYLPQSERKTVLLLCDDIRMHSGIATMGREFVVGSAHHFNWINLGAAINHPELGKTFDISADVNKHAGIDDADIKVIPSNGYGDASKVRQLLKLYKPDALFIFTDPRYWIWLFEIEREIRSEIPIFWLNIWDEYPAPIYNRNYYRSVDVLMAISKQTKLINEIVLGDEAKDKVIEYVPHGINPKQFFPIKADHEDYGKLQEFKSNLFNGKDIEFVLFFNSRNIQRKHPGDTILAYRHFCDKIGPEKASKCALVMKTEISSQHGTDLRAVKEAICTPEMNVFFIPEKLSTQQMNLLYNIADANVLISSNEGWGLSLTEAMMTGTMIIPNVTGGMQDQCRFVDEEGNWVELTPDFPSNHRGTYKECGEWAEPVFPANRSMMGSPLTPYIFDDRCNPEDAADAMFKVYSLSSEERNRRGMLGHDWVTGDESNMSSQTMSNRIIESMDKGFDKFEPRPTYDIIKVGESKSKFVPHKLTGY